MKRLLGGVRQKWATATTTKRIMSVVGMFVVAAFLMVIIAPHAVHAADPDPNANLPGGLKWVNRYYIVDSNGNNYYDGNTYDATFEYDEQGPNTCQNKIVFTYNTPSRGGASDELRNQAFFYDTTSQFTVDNAPNTLWNITFSHGHVVNNPNGQNPCAYDNLPNFKVDSNNFARRTTFYTSPDDQVISILSGVTFSRKGDFQGSARYFRDDEVGDVNNVCADMIVKHAANPVSEGEALFGKGDVAGSAMLYSVEKDPGLHDVSESYSWVSGSQNITPKTCHDKGDAIKKGGDYGLTSFSGNSDLRKFSAAGLDTNGSTKASGDEADDSFIIFIGSTDNMPKDPSTGGVITTPVGGTNGGNGNKNGGTCSAGAMGWLICPIIDAIQKGTAWLRDGLQAVLTVNPLPIGTGGLYDSWNNIRNFANIAFVGVFFVIIFSQATSIGITNYGIKRLLPRLIAVAIATNISYFICSVLIDTFNVLGVGITALFGAINNGDIGSVNVTSADGLLFTAGLAAGLTAAITTGAIVEAFPLIVGAFLSLLVAFVALAMRQVLLILLVVVSPLAFVCALLPGTQSWFRRWFDMFVALLAMYPLVMALFAAMALASSILSTVGA